MKALLTVFVALFLCFTANLGAQGNVFSIPIPDLTQDGDVIVSSFGVDYHWYFIAPDSNHLALRVYIQREYHNVPVQSWKPIEDEPTFFSYSLMWPLVYLENEDDPAGWYLVGKFWNGSNYTYLLNDISAMVGHYY